MICRVLGSISRPYRSRIGIVILFPQVGHCPSCPAIPSVASNRDEQYPQLNPYRLPPPRNVGGRKIPRSKSRVEVSGLAPGAPAPTPTPAIARFGAGTRSVVKHVGQRTSCPTCASSAESDV